jgi:nucleoside-diphosphate-sugar epimerase
VSRILVTGATGFIGRAAVADLADAGHEVRAAVRRLPASFAPIVEVRQHGDLDGRRDGHLDGHRDGDVDWRPLVAGMDAVVHLAGIAHAGRGAAARYERVNHLATATLAAAARDAGVKRVVFISTIRAQTGPAADHAVTEADATQPTDAYGRSKHAAEIALAQSGASFTILRPVLVYGPGVKGNLRALMRLAALPLPLPFGAFANKRSLVALANLLAAIRHVLQHEASRGETYLAADPHPVSLAEIVTAMRAGFGRSPGLIAVPPALVRAGLVMAGRRLSADQLLGQLIVDPKKLLATGWRPDPDTKGAIAAMTRQWAES